MINRAADHPEANESAWAPRPEIHQRSYALRYATGKLVALSAEALLTPEQLASVDACRADLVELVGDASTVVWTGRAAASGAAALEWLRCETERAVDEAWRRWMRDGASCEQYVWFRRGALAIAEERPDGFELACPERVPTHKERPAVIQWVTDRLGRVPCLPEVVVP